MNKSFAKFFVALFSIGIILFSNSVKSQSHTDTAAHKSIVMFGNSITFQGNWDEVLNRPDILKWGLPGYTTGQLIWTIKNVLHDYPGTKIWFIEGGINDISLGVPVKRIFENYKTIVDSLQRNNIIPVVQSTIYQNKSKDKNKKVKKANRLVKGYCIDHNIAYIDLNAVLSANGELKSELTTDGTHLKKEAYVLWAKLVKEMLEKIKLQ